MRYFFQASFLWVFLCVAITDLSAQDKKNNQTILWRIQKQGIEKPSFLFGTMHIYDKKAFNFQDSLYIYLEQAEAFALELNPDSANQIIAAYMSGELSNDEQKEDWSEHIAARDMEKIKKIADKDVKAAVIKDDKRGLIGYFVNRLINNEKKQTESMNTYMDAFLYEMAWQKGKKIFGLEELEGKAEVLKALSKGLKGKKINGLLDKWDPLTDESPVHRLYFKEDIDSIDLFFNEFFTESALDIFLFDRNQVMANRMDSIMQGQTLFAAVGTAHLPGEKGVIELLRKKGYVVEPVFSKNRISAEEYQFKNAKRNWQLIKNEGYGFQYQLPGVSKTHEGVQGRKVVYHYDIGGGSIFMTIYGKLSAAERKKNINDIITSHLDEMMQEGGGTVLSKKAIVYEGLKGIEALCLYDNNSYYKYREVVKDNIFYILSVGAQKKDNLSTEKAEQYFNSFKLIPLPKANWSAFSAPADGFSVLLPGKPIAEPQQLDKESAGMVSANVYSWFDASSGVSYSITSGKALAGNQYLEGDYFFQNYVDHVKSLAPEEPAIEDTVINGYAGKRFMTKSPDNRVKGFVLKRTNASYFVTAEYEPGNEAEAAVDKFLNSFQMTSFTQPVWSLQQLPDKSFTAWLPGQIQKKKQDSTAYDFKADEIQHFGHDPFASVSYDVEIYPISKYYWAPNIDSIYSYWKDRVVNAWSDSLLSFSVVKNGGLTGRQISLVNKTSKTRKIIRLLLNGNTMYVLATVPPLIYADEKNTNRFFSEFRAIKEETATAIIENNSDKLFADLQSKDSATFQQAYDALSEVRFMQKDITLLMDKSIQPYSTYENIYQSVNEKLLSQAETLLEKDTLAVSKERVNDFIRENYSKANKNIDSLRFYLLGMVAKNKTSESYQLVKELLASKKHAADYSYRFFGKLYDSLELTKTLYPDLLNYISDTTMDLAIVSLTKTMIDSNKLAMDILLPVKTELIKLAKKHAKLINKEEYGLTYEIPALIELLGYFKQKDADDAAAIFLKAKEIYVKKSAAITLIKNNKPVSASVLSRIANDLQHRVSLYEELGKAGKEKLFPADLRSQVGLAEGYIVNAIYDEEEEETIPEMIFIKRIEYNYKGTNKAFYIFRANYEYEMEEGAEIDSTVQWSSPDVTTGIKNTTTESHLTVAGPFDLNKSELMIDEKENISGGWYDDKFDGMKIDYFFRKYIERQLKWQEGRKKNE